MKQLHEQTYYELLEIEPSASQEDILKAYNRARITYGNNNPALYSVFSREEARELLQLIDEAYLILSNQFKRKKYDNQTINKTKVPEHLEPKNETSMNAIPDAGSTFSETEFEQVPTVIPSVMKSVAIKEVPKYEAPNVKTFSDVRTTKFGTYKIDQTFEKDISETEVFNGPLLQRIRIYKGVTIDQMATSTKIGRPYLNSLEKDQFTGLPAPVYVRGFLVQIAKLLGLNAEKVANSYVKTLKDSGSK